jgi:hypothetical protein
MEEENKNTKQKQFAHKRIITKTWKERTRRNSKTKISVHNCLHTINDKLNIEEEKL